MVVRDCWEERLYIHVGVSLMYVRPDWLSVHRMYEHSR